MKSHYDFLMKMYNKTQVSKLKQNEPKKSSLRKRLTQKLSEIKTKERKIGLKRLFGFFCSVILMYQTIQLLTDYLQFETIIMNENLENKLVIGIPGISICEKFPKVKFMIGERRIVRRVPPTVALKYESSGFIERKNGFFKMDLKQAKAMSQQSSPISATSLSKDQFEQVRNESVQCLLQPDKCEDKPKCYPNLISISMISQCRTFFSQINSKGVVVPKQVMDLEYFDPGEGQNTLAYFAINFTDINQNKGGLQEMDTFVMIHDSKAPPNKDTIEYSSRRFVIKPNRIYDLSFRTKTTVKLPNPYKTDCHYYESAINSTEIYSLSRVLCINRCINERIYAKFKCLRYGADLIYGERYSQIKLCDTNIQLRVEKGEDSLYWFEWDSRLICHKQCKPDCIQEVYEMDLHEVDNNELLDIFGVNQSSHDFSYITVLDKQFAESRYYHSPKIKLNDFLSNFGGIFSLWLGLSVISIYDYFSLFCSFAESKIKLLTLNYN